MSIEMIAAVGKNYELGKNNDLIWRFKEDMQFFKKTTTGSAVIMGRKTFESLPKALPNRQNIVISSNSEYIAEGAEVVGSIDEAIEHIKGDKAFIIGGASVYKAFLPYAKAIYLTEINAGCPDANAYFPKFDKNDYSREVLGTVCDNEKEFSFVKYSKL
ncbi:MAG: dihydrofolate reductase [Eubacterium sp.]|nr:dihydrofolate reductase [Eubacterium sp.]MBR7061356.1 dihydrofolate reductase [Eubacterium sp.]